MIEVKKMELVVHHDTRNIIAFSSVKDLFKKLGLDEQNFDPSLSKSLYLFYPTDIVVKSNFYQCNLNLTEKIPLEQRIRYRTKNVLDSIYARIIDYINTSIDGEKLSVCVLCNSCLDEFTQRFFEMAEKFGSWDITYKIQHNYSVGSVVNQRDEELYNKLSTLKVNGKINFNKDLYDNLIDFSLEYLNAGDALTAKNICNFIKSFYSDSDLWNILSVSEQVLKNAIMSEYYLDLILNNNNIEKYKNGSRYSKAMLYARMHSQELQNIEKSEYLLNQAYDEITSSDEYLNNISSAIFSALFNRNGYALILFRKNKIEEAKNLMLDCISQIDNIYIVDRQEELDLYRSVLVYNLAQCYERLGDYDNAIISLNKLLDKDRLMDTYYLDLARVYGSVNDIDSAISSCKQTIFINPYSHQNWAMLAYWQLQKTLYSDSALNYYHAYKLCLDSKKSLVYLNNILYSKILSKEKDCCPDVEIILKDFITNKELFSFDENEIIKSFSLLAEMELCKGNQKQALDYLSLALGKFPNNVTLKQNYEFLSSL